MNMSELHAAVMASPGPLEDEVCARLWCLVHGKNLLSIQKGIAYNIGAIWIAHDESIPTHSYEYIGYHNRPDISTDAALDLVRVRFPDASPAIVQSASTLRWSSSLVANEEILIDGPWHTDRRLAIIAALLKAMGA